MRFRNGQANISCIVETWHVSWVVRTPSGKPVDAPVGNQTWDSDPFHANALALGVSPKCNMISYVILCKLRFKRLIKLLKINLAPRHCTFKEPRRKVQQNNIFLCYIIVISRYQICFCFLFRNTCSFSEHLAVSRLRCLKCYE